MKKTPRRFLPVFCACILLFSISSLGAQSLWQDHSSREGFIIEFLKPDYENEEDLSFLTSVTFVSGRFPVTGNTDVFRLGYEDGRQGRPYAAEPWHPELQLWYEYGRLLAAELPDPPPWQGHGPGGRPVMDWLPQCPAYVAMRTAAARGLGFAFNHTHTTLHPSRPSPSRADRRRRARLAEFLQK